MKISRNGLEKLTTSLSVTLLVTMVIVMTLVVANYTFGWDLFPANIEKIGLVAIIAMFFTILSSVVINITVNLGRIADHFDHRNEH